MTTLPNGWAETALGDITVDCSQRIPTENEEFCYVDISSVDRNTKKITNPQRLLGKDAPSRARKEIRTGDILVSMTRPNLNGVALVPAEFDGQIASTGFDVLRAVEVDPRWLYYIVRSNHFVDAMSDLVQGALYPAVRSKDVRGFHTVLAPLAEQRRIADKLDNLLARVDACRDRLDRIPSILKRFRQAMLIAATNGALTCEWRNSKKICEPADAVLERSLLARKANSKTPRDSSPVAPDVANLPSLPEGWCWASLDQLLLSLRNGIATKPNEAHGLPILRISSVRPLAVNLTDVRYLPLGTNPQDYELRNGDLLFTRYNGNPELVGVCGMVRDLNGSTVYPDKLIRGRVDLSLVDPEFLELAVNTGFSKSAVDAKKKTAAGQVGISGADLKCTPVPLPPLEEQQVIVKLCRSLLNAEGSVHFATTNATERLSRIQKSLLSKAFRGELVPQDPNDEPASVLLERIRSEQAGSAAPKAKRGRKPRVLTEA